MDNDVPFSLYVRVRMQPEFWAAVSLRQELLQFLIGLLVPWDKNLAELRATEVDDANWSTLCDQ